MVNMQNKLSFLYTLVLTILKIFFCVTCQINFIYVRIIWITSWTKRTFSITHSELLISITDMSGTLVPGKIVIYL